MATGNFLLDKGYRAGAAITKFRAVKFSTTPETVIPVAAITDQVIGFAQFSVSAGEITKGKGTLVRTTGITEAEASAAIALGAAVSIGADGRVKTAAVGERVVGMCAGHPAGAAGDRITLDLTVAGHLSP